MGKKKLPEIYRFPDNYFETHFHFWNQNIN